MGLVAVTLLAIKLDDLKVYGKAVVYLKQVLDWARPASSGAGMVLSIATSLEEEPSFQQVVDLGPHLCGIVVVWPIDLPPSAGLLLSLRGAPVEYGAMCRR